MIVNILHDQLIVPYLTIFRWMFRTFGHNIVSILDGGLPAWLKYGGTTTDKIESFDKENFNSVFVPKLYRSHENVVENLSSKQDLILDARAEGRFCGITAEPRKGDLSIPMFFHRV